MSIDYYQKEVNALDKDIANLEKKKADVDKAAAEYERKAANVSISKNASATTVKSKLGQIDRYKESARKASLESASLLNKIAAKRKKRNEAALRLQKEEQWARNAQDRAIEKMRQSYEKRIEELQAAARPTVPMPTTKAEVKLPEYDVFVSHAWEDKDDFVDEFVDALISINQ